ncbi:MAG: DUF309 domain-containing protein [Defluviitaleaceae bacterium]|nr:DUF309 domain-containing protein [Defluviitaleaceae bacterium]
MFEPALIDYLVEFHAKRDYFECHEVLEERWKEDVKADRQLYWVALIQVAVGNYHYRRNNLSGAKKMLERAIEKIKATTPQLEQLGLQVTKLLERVEQQVVWIEKEMPYESIDLPLHASLMAACLDECQSKGIVFLQKSDLTDHYLLNKHRLRPREA